MSGRVLVTRVLPPGSLDPLLRAGCELTGPGDERTRPADDRALTHQELCEAASGVDGIVSLLTDRIDDAVLTAGQPRLKVVANVAVGYDNIDVRAARRLGVKVCNTPGVLDETTADAAFLLILAASRLASTAEADLRGGRWGGWGINQYLGHDVHGSTLGVVGWGRIGRAVARRASGFGMDVLHHSRTDDGEPGYVASLDQLLARSDVVTLHVPLTPETHHLIDARRLALMKPTAVLVNTARGAVVDEVALADALREGAIFAAGLDVFEDEPRVHPSLLSAPRTVLLPHLGSATVATRTAMGRLATEAVVDVLHGRTPPNLVDAVAGPP
jgi:glyoxylate reductase